MRSTSLVLAAVTGRAVSVFAAPAGALTPLSSAGVGSAAQSVDPIASVHCRPYKHRSYNHGWGYGCRGGAHVTIHEREGGRVHRRGYEEREGVSVHERSSTRSETNVRSRERSTTRGSREGSEPRGGVKGGGGESSTKGGSSTTGNRSETGGTSGGGSKSSGGGTSGQNSGTKQ
jgi:hypothetical protein